MYSSKQISVGTHNGIFHYDEVVAIALISILHNGNISVVRSRNPNALKLCDIVVDVGGGIFDHHMPGGNGCRDSGTSYASAGLIWQAYGPQILSTLGCSKSHIATCHSRVDKELIEDLDKIDNGMSARSPFEFISYFLPNWDEAKSSDLCFIEALTTVTPILKKAIFKIIREENDNINLRIALAISGSGNIMDIPSQFIKWQPVILEHNATSSSKIDFVIFPYPAGGYAAQCVPPSASEPFKQRIPFPKAWAGQTEKLPKISKVKGATFCHNACFFVRGKTHEDVVELCKIATANSKK